MSTQSDQAIEKLGWWNSLRHGGLLLDAPRLSEVVLEPPALNSYAQDRLRRELSAYVDAPDAKRGEFVKYVMGVLCGFERTTGEWYRGSEVSKQWSRTAITGETIRPSHLWIGKRDAILPVFIDKEKRLGIGRGVRIIGHALQWMRKTGNRLAIVTNGDQWRILYAGLDYEAFAEWDQRQWFSEGEPSPELEGFRSLVHPELLTPPEEGADCRLLEAINDSRKGQAELSQVLGERVRQAAELLIQGHSQALEGQLDRFTPQELYRAAVRMIMRMVVILFAESREGLLPRDNPVYHLSYSLQGLRDQLERINPLRLRNGYAAYPRIVALCRLVYEGSSHEALLVPTYGGQLFEAGDPNSSDGVSRAVAVLEQGCYEHDVMNDQQVRNILDLLSRTKIKIRQGRQSTWIPAPVDFSSLDSEYIGILYEGLLDFELRQAGQDDPVVFLAVGNQPALPLTTLEAMDEKALKNLLEKMKDTSSGSDDDEEDEEQESDEAEDEQVAEDGDGDQDSDESDDTDEDGQEDEDSRLTLRARAEQWAHRAIEVGKLVTKPRGKLTEEKKLQYQAAIDRKARQIVTKVILPGEWYLVRWGGTRKGSGTFYTRPQLAIPTVHRTLRPLAYEPPPTSEKFKEKTTLLSGRVASNASGEGANAEVSIAAEKAPELHRELTTDPTDSYKASSSPTTTPTSDWIPKRPEEILSLKVCDPACGSGSFPLAALRFLTEALYASLHHYNRIQYYSDRTVIDLIKDQDTDRVLSGELLPCRPEDNDFEARTKAVLRRYVVERCIYGVDLDPMAVELCRLSLWIETLDPRLPFTFLDHKIKCGNSLIGTWFDQFMHYPAMAWMREGGDKSHSTAVHFKVEKGSDQRTWTQAISDRVSEIKSQLINYIDGQEYYNTGEDLDAVKTVHDDAERALARIHHMGVHEADQRAKAYHELCDSQAYQDAKFSLDLWCSIWFWPPERIEECPLPNEFYQGQLSSAGQAIVRELATSLRFFHWQLEFPDVFGSELDGFDGVLGNPPWDIAKPNSKEFFSALDPLYRSYGKQEALRKQREYFEASLDTERRWLEYNARFRAQSNWVKNSGDPYGNTIKTDSKGKQTQELNIGGGGGGSFDRSKRRHEKWKDNREGLSGYSQLLEDVRGFHHQGSGDINLYKMFLEQAHAILADGGRLGFIVPSGLYSDHGTGALRTLFLEHCRWQWLFGFENREKVFDIDSRFKFNPVIIQKGGQTEAIQTAFMRRDLEDWEQAEEFITAYPRERVLQFSPRSKAILEIQSQRDLEVLEKIYSNSVLLGDDGPDGWGITYSREFDMTNDSVLFPPRDKWEERGYRPDEYSRWLKGNWRPIEELYSELGVKPLPEGERRLAQPQYAHLPVPRADIPAGIILSRDGQSWMSEDEIGTDEFKDKKGKKHTGQAIAVPVFEGRMISHFDFSNKGWVSGKGRTAVWDEIPWEGKRVDPQFLMATTIYENDLINSQFDELKKEHGDKHAKEWRTAIDDTYTRNAWRTSLPNRVAFMDVTSATNERTMTASPGLDMPYGNSAPIFRTRVRNVLLASALTSLTYDFVARFRCGGLHLNWFVVDESSLPKLSSSIESALLRAARPLLGYCPQLSVEAIRFGEDFGAAPAITNHERLRRKAMLNACIALAVGLNEAEYRWILGSCDYPMVKLRSNDFTRGLPPKGFWRVDKTKAPEHRLTSLSLVAYLDAINQDCNPESSIIDFLSQNDGEGWQLPETLRLADYGLGHDDRAMEYQPVRECFGPRFYDWQLEQSPEESWRECHLHARNLLGPTGYQALVDRLNGDTATHDNVWQVSAPESDLPDPNEFELTSAPQSKRTKRK